MKISVCQVITIGIASAALASCSALRQAQDDTQSPMGAGQVLPQTSMTTYAGTPACPNARLGEAQCLVLIQSKSGISPAVGGWAPMDFQTRYKLPIKQGKGQIVAIVDAYDNPNVASDLAVYRKNFGLGKVKFLKYNQEGEQKNYPSGSVGWGVEIDLDVQMASASCPLCSIYLIEANSSNSTDLQTAEVTAAKLGAHIISNSWICYDSVACVNTKDFSKKGVEYLAASGDNGLNHVGAPAALDTVAAVGGTILSKSGSQYSESVWPGAGGGCATGVKKPKWQHDKVCSGRAVSDASAVAFGVAEYDSYGYHGWFTVGGTSVASPLLAGTFGLAGNADKQEGGRTFWETKHHKDLWDVCGSSCLFSTYSYGGGWGSPDGITAF